MCLQKSVRGEKADERSLGADAVDAVWDQTQGAM